MNLPSPIMTSDGGRAERSGGRGVALAAAAALAGFLLGFAAGRADAAEYWRGLEVREESDAAYSRTMYPHWTMRRGASTRDIVLGEERMAGGLWACRFTGRLYDDPSVLDVDHLVPLKEAHESGGWRWNAARRVRYANSVGYPDHLVAVHRSANRSKGARDPAEWMPERGRCWYAAAWIEVKRRWNLSVDAAERDALDAVLEACRG